MYKFARTRYVYDSYSDFWRMVEIAGLPTCYVDEIDPGDSDCTYVTTPLTGELKSRRLLKRHCKIIFWNLERPDGEFVSKYHEVVEEALAYVDDIWVSDQTYHAMAPARTKFVVMGSRKELRLDAVPIARYDVAHLSYVNYRRGHIYGQLHQHGLQVAPNGWGLERAAILNGSSLLLNVHQTEALIGEPLRFAIAAAHSSVLVSETLAAPYPMTHNLDYFDISYGGLKAVCMHLLGTDKAYRDQIGANLHRLLCVEHEFPKGALEQLKRTGGV